MQTLQQYTQALKTMKTHKPGTKEHTEAWQEAERIKNLNEGMPPVPHEVFMLGPIIVWFGPGMDNQDKPDPRNLCLWLWNGHYWQLEIDHAEPSADPNTAKANAINSLQFKIAGRGSIT